MSQSDNVTRSPTPTPSETALPADARPPARSFVESAIDAYLQSTV
ncbi:unnamed protein product [Penicillium salamii]|nr:unnamed protein product [Penicillium salamii]